MSQVVVHLLDLRKLFSWLVGYRIWRGDQERLEELVAGLAANEFRVYLLEGERIVDSGAFFTEAASSFAFPEYFGRNWDALIDSLGDLEDRADRRVAVVWSHATHSAQHDPAMFAEAVHWILTVSDDLRTADAHREVTQLELVLLV